MCYNKEKVDKGWDFVPRTSNKDKEILKFLQSYILEKGYPPSVREIGAAVNLKSTSAVHAQLKKLEERGFIAKENTKTRAIRLIRTPQVREEVAEFLQVPVLGTIQAGSPVYAEENVIDTFPLPMSFAKNSDIFMLKVYGESMIEAAILPNDYIIVQKQSTCQNGDIVVALIGDTATVKTFYKENGHYRLQPENSYMDPIIVDEVSILGKVVGVFRSL